MHFYMIGKFTDIILITADDLSIEVSIKMFQMFESSVETLFLHSFCVLIAFFYNLLVNFKLQFL